jgi:ATP-dependent DNA ligase
MPLSRLRGPFDDPDWIFELKYDGFRALAYMNGGGAELFSRRDLRYRQFADLCSEISLVLNADDAVLDGEIVKLDESGRPIFVDLMRRSGRFQFVAFDVLALNGKDVRSSRSWSASVSSHRAKALEFDSLRTACRRSRQGALRSSLQPGP